MRTYKTLYILVGLGIGGLLGWFGLREIEWTSVRGALSDLDWRIVLMAVGALGFAWLLSAYRWKLLLQKEKVSLLRLFLVQQAGVGVNMISPVRVLAEATQTAMLTYTDKLRAPKVVSSIALSRLFDLLVTLSLVGVGLIILPQLSGFRPVVVPLWGITAASVLAFLMLGRRIHRLPGIWRIPFLEQTAQSIGTTHGRFKILLACAGITGLSWMFIGLGAWLVAQAVGISLPFWLISMVIVAIMLFSSTVPAPPGVVGVYEFVAMSTLALFAVAPGAALAFAVVTHALLFVLPLLVAIPVLVVERRTVGGLRALAVQMVGSKRKQPHPSGSSLGS
jgi:uncharacterized membrane protein YbhN (UPF0104 family)